MDVPLGSAASGRIGCGASPVQCVPRRLGALYVFGVAFGIGAHVLFGWTVWQLFSFLRDGSGHSGRFSPLLDFVLAAQFCVPHSLLLWPPAAKWLRRFIPQGLYGCMFTTVTCLGLLTMIGFWQPSAGAIWNLVGLPRIPVLAGFYASWAALIYSLSLEGLGYQTGLTQWWHWVRGRPQPRRTFEPKGAYRWFRHPIYLSFLGLIWFCPTMTWDHAILTLTWTVYLLLGSYWKDRRLLSYLGDSYREYRARVPGYPGVFWGPLGRG